MFFPFYLTEGGVSFRNNEDRKNFTPRLMELPNSLTTPEDPESRSKTIPAMLLWRRSEP